MLSVINCFITDILRYSQAAKIRLKSCKALHNKSFSSCKIHFVDVLLNNNEIVVLAEYHLVLVNTAYALVG